MPERPERFRPKKLRVAKRGQSFYFRYGSHWEDLRLRVLIRDNWQCRHCGRVCGDRWEAQVDHIVPKRLGGGDGEDQLQTLCIQCHHKKTMHERRGL